MTLGLKDGAVEIKPLERDELETTAIDRSLAVIFSSLAGACAGVALLMDRPLFADQAGTAPTTVWLTSNAANALCGALKQIDCAS